MGRDFTIFRSLGPRPSVRTEQHDSRWLNGQCRAPGWEGLGTLLGAAVRVTSSPGSAVPVLYPPTGPDGVGALPTALRGSLCLPGACGLWMWHLSAPRAQVRGCFLGA